LNIKGIPHKTVWVEYPDVNTVYEKHNIEAPTKRPDGSPYYSVPVIHDPKTGKTIADSLLIAEYLDETYPETHRIVPEGTHALQEAFVDAFENTLSNDFYDLICDGTAALFTGRSKAWFNDKGWRRGLESEEAGIRSTQKNLGKVDKWYKPGEKFLSSSQKLIFADLEIAGFLGWARRIWGEDSAQWQEVLKWHEGRWKTLFEELRPFEQVW